MVTFILADRQELTCFAVEHLTDALPQKKVLYAPDKTELIQQLKQYGRSVVVVDYALFDFFGVEDFLVINQRFPQAAWIIASDDLTEAFLRQVVFQTHNVSIVFKDAPLKEFQSALTIALRGDRYICQRVTEILLSTRQAEPQLPSMLTSTEIEIVHAIAQGKTTKEIAAERFSSIHTINTHRKNIFRKLEVNTAHEAIKKAVRSGLIDESEYYI